MRRLALSGMALGIAACHIIGGYPDFEVVGGEGGAGGNATSTGGDGQGGDAAPCSTPDDCPAPSSECEVATCEASRCGTAPKSAGEMCSIGACNDAGQCRCTSNGDCATDCGDHCICVNEVACVSPYAYAVAAKPTTSGQVSLVSASLIDTGPVAAFRHTAAFDLKRGSHSELIAAAPMGGDAVDIAWLSDGAEAPIARARLEAEASFAPFVDADVLNGGAFVVASTTAEVSASIVGGATTAVPANLEQGYVAYLHPTKAPLLQPIAPGVRPESVACTAGRCIVAGTHTAAFTMTISGQSVSTPQSRGAFLIAYDVDLAPLWVVFLEPNSGTTIDSPITVAVVGEQGHASFRFSGGQGVDVLVPGMAAQPIPGGPSGTLAVLPFNATMARVVTATQLSTGLSGDNAIASGPDAFAIAANNFGGPAQPFFGPTQFEVPDGDCAVARFDIAESGAAQNPIAAIIGGAGSQACRGLAINGDHILASFVNSTPGEDILIGEAGTPEPTTVKGTMGIAAWEAAQLRHAWSVGLSLGDPPEVAFARIGTSRDGAADGFVLGADAGVPDGRFHTIAPGVTVEIPDCEAAKCGAILVRMANPVTLAAP